MKIIFFGTSGFATVILRALARKFEVIAVVTQPDKPAGRSHTTEKSKVGEEAEKLGLKVLKFDSLKSPDVENELKKFGADLFVVAAYGRIIPKNIISLPKKGAINVHGSLLPKYRGASPIQSAIKDGKTQTGITIMLMDEYVDHGPILAQDSLSIEKDDTAQLLEEKLAILGQNLLLNAIERYSQGLISPSKQDHSQATETHILSKHDGKINWHKSASEIYNLFRAYAFWPEVWTVYGNEILKIKKCSPSLIQSELIPGTVFQQDDKIYVACLNGSLQLLEIQIAGKKNMDIKAFINGHKAFIGSVLN